MKRIIRVFPRRTRWTPDDEHVAVNRGPELFDDYDLAHISVAFSFDKECAFQLFDMWMKHCETRIGGPAFNVQGFDFEPGLYLKKGAVITSRGCPRNCWFCSVPKREGNDVRELPIRDGWNIFDDNLLRCSESHVRGVFEMLKRQSKPATFSGGLEAAVLHDWHIDLFERARVKRMFFAYDTPDDYEPLIAAGQMFQKSRLFSVEYLNCYVLVGYPGDTLEKAEKRCLQCLDAGFMPFAMLYADDNGRRQDADWRKFQKVFARPAIVKARFLKGKPLGQDRRAD